MSLVDEWATRLQRQLEERRERDIVALFNASPDERFRWRPRVVLPQPKPVYTFDYARFTITHEELERDLPRQVGEQK